jgi:hypothetical protein
MADLSYEILHENVYYFPGVIPEIATLIRTLDEVNGLSVTPWEPWHANNDPDEPVYGDLKTLSYSKLRQEADAHVQKKSAYILNTLLNAMENCCRVFMEAHGASADELEHLRSEIYSDGPVYGIRKYNEGGGMGPHPDRTIPDKDTYTISVYLDDDYEGGELAVVQGGLDISIKNKAGSIVVFPSGYLHESKRLTRGRKTIITHVHTTLRPILRNF